jgi:hypothetical protein
LFIAQGAMSGGTALRVAGGTGDGRPDRCTAAAKLGSAAWLPVIDHVNVTQGTSVLTLLELHSSCLN